MRRRGGGVSAANSAKSAPGRPFQKGKSGNPSGRPKGTSFASVIAAKLEEIRDGRTTREAVVAAAIDKALAGDMAAIQWVVDRTDGKLKDQTEHIGEVVVRVLRDRR